MKKVVNFLLQMTAVVLGFAQDTTFTVLDDPQAVTFQADRGIVFYDLQGSRSLSGVAAEGFPITLDLPERGDWLTVRHYPQGRMMDSVSPIPKGPLRSVKYYLVRVPLPDSLRPPTPPDTANILRGLSWRHILYDAKGSFENYADTLFRANTYQVPGVHAHTPQVVASGWSAEKGDSLYAQFQVRGSIDEFRLDINTGPVGPRAWAMHFTDTFPVTDVWTWHTAGFVGRYNDPDNRFDINLGLDTGRVELRHISLRKELVSSPVEPLPPPTKCDTVYITQVDTVTLPTPPPDTLILSRTDTLYIGRTDTLYLDRIDTLYLRPDVYLIQEVDGQEVGRTKINR